MKHGSCIILLWINLNWNRCIHCTIFTDEFLFWFKTLTRRPKGGGGQYSIAFYLIITLTLQFQYPLFSRPISIHFLWKVSWENLLKDQSIFRWVIILLILATFLLDYASVNSSCAQAPWFLQGICLPCQSQGWGINKFCAARGSGIRQPGGHPRAFHMHLLSYLNVTTV